MVPLGTLLAGGAAGLLAGFVVPVVGAAAAFGLVLYFIDAVVAHLRVGDRRIGGAVFFLLLATDALTAKLRMLGPVSETDDALQEAWLRIRDCSPSPSGSPCS